MLPFCRQLVKTVARELSTGQSRQTCASFAAIGQEMARIHLQWPFKSIVLLGGVEKALMAMKKVILLLE